MLRPVSGSSWHRFFDGVSMALRKGWIAAVFSLSLGWQGAHGQDTAPADQTDPAVQESEPPAEPAVVQPEAAEPEASASEEPDTAAPTDQAVEPAAAPAELPAPPNPQPQVRALVGATIIRGDGSPPIADGVVLIGAKRITAVGKRDEVSIPDQAQVIDVTGRWITPGLIDAHVHFFQSGSLYTRPDVIDLRDIRPYEEELAATKAELPNNFRRYLAAGITSVFDAGGPNWNFDVRALADGAKAPRVAVAGPLIATEPTPLQDKLVVNGDAPIISAPTSEEAAALAENLLTNNPDAIKIWGIGNGAQGAARVRDITAAVKAVAKPAGVPVAVHATNLDMAKAAVLGGADILVHSIDDRDIDGEFIRLLKNSSVTYVSTLVVMEGYRDAFASNVDLSTEERRLAEPRVLRSLSELPPGVAPRRGDSLLAAQNQAKRNLKALHDNGVRIAAGSDAGNIGTLHGGSFHRELSLLADAGVPPLDVITMATQNAAYALSPNPDFGMLKAGFAADLLVLKANPVDDVTNLAKIETVWIGGREIPRREILPRTADAVVQEQLDAYNEQDLATFAKSFADDVRIITLSQPGTPTVAGKNKLKEVYGSLFGLPDERKVRCEVAHRITEANFVTDQVTCRTLDGRSIRARTTAVYQVEKGLIKRVWFTE